MTSGAMGLLWLRRDRLVVADVALVDAQRDLAPSDSEQQARRMTGPLAFVDWVALILAAVLIAAALAAALVAFIAALHRNRNVPVAHASVEPTTVDIPNNIDTAGSDRTIDLRPKTMVNATPLSETDEEESVLRHRSATTLVTARTEIAEAEAEAAPPASSDRASRAAERARRLRQRPEPDTGEASTPTVMATPAEVGRAVGGPEAEHAAPDRRPVAGTATRLPGFFEDPMGRHDERYWDGQRWTEHVKEDGQRFIDPL